MTRANHYITLLPMKLIKRIEGSCGNYEIREGKCGRFFIYFCQDENNEELLSDTRTLEGAEEWVMFNGY